MSGIRNLNGESKKIRLLFDTKPLIKLFAEEEGYEAVKALLEKVEAGELEGGISVVTLTEVYYKYVSEGREDLAIIRTEQLRYALNLKKFAVNEDIALRAGQFKGKYKVPIADAFIAATAKVADALVVSEDIDFKNIDEIRCMPETELDKKLRVDSN